MKRELGFGRCGLAYCLCGEYINCKGCFSNECLDKDWCHNRKCTINNNVTHCYKCNKDCKEGMLSKIKPLAFSFFMKRYGEEALLDALERNEKNGIVYHRDGFNGDYDGFNDVEELIEFIKTGKKNTK